jgi:hypothetical protein
MWHAYIHMQLNLLNFKLEPCGRGKSSRFYLELSGQTEYVCFHLLPSTLYKYIDQWKACHIHINFTLRIHFFYFVHTFLLLCAYLEPCGQRKSSWFYLKLNTQAEYVCFCPLSSTQKIYIDQWNVCHIHINFTILLLFFYIL